MQNDPAKLDITVKRWTVRKFEGNPPTGSHDYKEPFELVVGADGKPTRFLHPGDPGFDEEWAIDMAIMGLTKPEKPNAPTV